MRVLFRAALPGLALAAAFALPSTAIADGAIGTAALTASAQVVTGAVPVSSVPQPAVQLRNATGGCLGPPVERVTTGAQATIVCPLSAATEPTTGTAPTPATTIPRFIETTPLEVAAEDVVQVTFSRPLTDASVAGYWDSFAVVPTPTPKHWVPQTFPAPTSFGPQPLTPTADPAVWDFVVPRGHAPSFAPDTAQIIVTVHEALSQTTATTFDGALRWGRWDQYVPGCGRVWFAPDEQAQQCPNPPGGTAHMKMPQVAHGLQRTAHGLVLYFTARSDGPMFVALTHPGGLGNGWIKVAQWSGMQGEQSKVSFKLSARQRKSLGGHSTILVRIAAGDGHSLGTRVLRLR